MGKLIVLEGLDGSGKATQSRLLTAALDRAGARVRRISFPDYESNASWPVRMYLGGEFGPKPEDVNAYAASVLYAVDRFASFRKDWGAFYQEGGILIADRYTTSNAVHQCSKLPREEWESYLNWLFDLEYGKIGIPQPDAVFYLEVDPAVSQQLLSGRYQGDEGKKDIHERDAEYLAHSRAAAAYCAERLGWQRVACCEDGRMLPAERIAAVLLEQTRRFL